MVGQDTKNNGAGMLFEINSRVNDLANYKDNLEVLKKYNINYLIAKDTNFNEDKNIILVYKNNKFSIYQINK